MANVEAESPTVFDTDLQYLGDVYAKALLGVGKDANKLDDILGELKSFVKAMKELPDVQRTLASPRVPADSKISLIDKMTAKTECSSEFRNFLKVLAEKGRFDCLPSINSSAQEMFNELSGRVQAMVTTATEIDSKMEQEIAQKLSKRMGKEVVVKSLVDPAIIGGMVVRVGDTVFDSSVANDLKRVRKATVERASQEIRKSLDRFTT